MDRFLWVGLGGFLGANARYLISGWAAERWGAAFPYGTLLVNATGSLALGFFLTLANERILVEPRYRLFIGIGFLGAYTTFSTYAFESVSLAGNGDGWIAAINLVVNNAIALLGAMTGIVLARWIA